MNDSNDLAMFILDKPLTNAVAGVDYAELYNPEDHGHEDLTGADIVLTGFGMWGPFVPGKFFDYWDTHLSREVKFHRGFNAIENI